MRGERLEDRQLLTILPISFPLSGMDDYSNSMITNSCVSSDGRYVVFESRASNLVPSDSNSYQDIFLRDTQTGTTSLISTGLADQANGDSSAPSISTDGRYITFSSRANNLVFNDVNSADDIFVRDLRNQTTVLVSIGDSGEGNDDSEQARISANGRFVVFLSDANNLVSGDTNGRQDIFVRDLQASTITRADISNGDSLGDRNLSFPSISADGRYTAFASNTKLTPDDSDLTFDVFVYDRQTGEVKLASTGFPGVDIDNSLAPQISADGNYIAFEGHGVAVMPGSDIVFPYSYVFVRNLLNSTTAIGSIDSNGQLVNAYKPSISADGHFITYVSDGVVLRDMWGQVTTQVSPKYSGQVPFESDSPSISSNGHFVAFVNSEGGLVPSDSKDDRDVFIWTEYPAAAPDNQAIYVPQNIAQPIALTASHPTGLPLNYAVLKQPQHGILSGVAPNLIYTPTVDFLGEDAFTFTANDGRFNSVPATVALTVVDPTPPTVVATQPVLGGALTLGATSLQVLFSKAVLGAGLTGNYQLQRSGVDGLLGTADDEFILIIAAKYSANSATLYFPPLRQGDYRLTVNDTITDTLLQKRLDGNHDGLPLGNFTATFGVTSEPEGAGMRDASFGVGGKVTTTVLGSDEYGAAIAVQSDGKLLVVGDFSTANANESQFNVVRYSADGSLDMNFGVGGRISTFVGAAASPKAIVVQPDGKFIVAGYSFHELKFNFALARYDSNGSLDTGFGDGGIVLTAIGEHYAFCYSIALQPDGKIIAAGTASGPYDDDSALVRYNIDGTLDGSFGLAGIQTKPQGGIANAIALQPDGKIVTAGYGNNIGYTYVLLSRYKSDGSLDEEFGQHGSTSIGFGSAHAVMIQPNGDILAAGSWEANNKRDFFIERFQADGSLDGSFGTGGVLITDLGSNMDVARAITQESDGKIVAAGYSTSSNGSDFALIRCNSDGTLDKSFDDDGQLITPIGEGADTATSMVLQPDGKIVVAGYTYNGRDNDFAVVRYDTRSLAAQVVDRHLFYNNSTFDGRSTGASVADDGAVALGKTGLRSGMTASFANISSYGRGINGVMIDIARLPSQALAADDFQFHIGHDNLPTTWNVAPGPQSISIRKGAGTGGSDRVTLIWPDGLIKNEWLEITLLPNAATGLAQPHVFYFGSAVADSGTDLGHAIINITDELGARTHTTMLRNPATLDNIYDYNRDGRVNASDEILARNSETTLATAVKLITVPAGIQATASKVSSDFSDNGAAIGIAGPMNAAVKMPTTSLLATEPQPHSAGIASLEADAVCLPMIPRAQAAGDRIPPGDSEVDSDEDLYNLIAIDLIACFHDTGRIALA